VLGGAHGMCGFNAASAALRRLDPSARAAERPAERQPVAGR